VQDEEIPQHEAFEVLHTKCASAQWPVIHIKGVQNQYDNPGLLWCRISEINTKMNMRIIISESHPSSSCLLSWEYVTRQFRWIGHDSICHSDHATVSKPINSLLLEEKISAYPLPYWNINIYRGHFTSNQLPQNWISFCDTVVTTETSIPAKVYCFMAIRTWTAES
jgi:hypothetical protein